MASLVEGRRGSCYLGHYNQLHIKIDMLLTPKSPFFETTHFPYIHFFKFYSTLLKEVRGRRENTINLYGNILSFFFVITFCHFYDCGCCHLNNYLKYSLNWQSIYALELKYPFENIELALGTCSYQANCDACLILHV